MSEISIPAPENKAGEGAPAGHEITDAFDDFMRAFESFRQANDARLDELEKRMTADAVTVEKVDRINRALDEHKRRVDALALKAGRPGLAGGAETSIVRQEHGRAFEAYVRHGAEHELKGIEAKAMSAGSDPDGGYLVPDETAREIGRRLAEISPIRAIAGVREISGSVYKKPFAVSGPATGWVGETAARPQTASGTLAELAFPAMEIYAMPAATQTLLDDAAVNIDEWIAEEVRIAFAEQEGVAFVNGDGVNKPRGFLDYDREAESAWEWGKLGYLATGVDGGFAASDPADRLIDLVHALKSGYRQNASFVMNRRTQGEVRKLKDGDGRYIWQPAAQAGASATILNFPVAEAEDMPDIAADAPAIAFGDFRRGYLVVDRLGIRVLRDPYSAKPYVLFYTTKRVGGGVQDFDAIKLMVFGQD